MPGMMQPKRVLTQLDDAGTRWRVKVWPLDGDQPEEMVLNFTMEQWNKWQAGLYIQSALGHLTADEREFLLSGTTAEKWNKLWKDD